jgi:hypothetical protein
VTEGAIAWLLYEAIVRTVEVSSPEVGANVGHLFSKTMNQRPSSFVTLSPLGYNDLRTKVMKDVPSSFQYARIKIKTYETRNEYE